MENATLEPNALPDVAPRWRASKGRGTCTVVARLLIFGPTLSKGTTVLGRKYRVEKPHRFLTIRWRRESDGGSRHSLTLQIRRSRRIRSDLPRNVPDMGMPPVSYWPRRVGLNTLNPFFLLAFSLHLLSLFRSSFNRTLFKTGRRGSEWFVDSHFFPVRSSTFNANGRVKRGRKLVSAR